MQELIDHIRVIPTYNNCVIAFSKNEIHTSFNTWDYYQRWHAENWKIWLTLLIIIQLKASEAMSRITIILIAVAVALPDRAKQESLGEPKVLIYGNYCGPGNNAPLPPIDALNAACARHDACTPNGKTPSHACNLRLRSEADALARDPEQSPDLRAMAGIIAAGAAVLETSDGAGEAPASIQPGSSKSAKFRP